MYICSIFSSLLGSFLGGKIAYKALISYIKPLPERLGVYSGDFTPVCKDSAWQIAAVPGYQEAHVDMVLSLGLAEKPRPQEHAGGGSPVCLVLEGVASIFKLYV